MQNFQRILLVIMGLITAAQADQHGDHKKNLDLLPDLKTSCFRLHGAFLDTTTEPGRRFIVFSNSTPNVGRGSLELRTGKSCGDKQEIYQRIYLKNHKYRDHFLGEFPNENQGSLNIERFTVFRLRTVPLDGSYGETVVTTATKSSGCLTDTKIFNPFKRGFSCHSKYDTCGSVQGISVGWTNLKRWKTYQQKIDITGIKPGEYWLESEVNPDKLILEKKTTNNIARIKVCIHRDDFSIGGCVKNDPRIRFSSNE